MYWNLDELPLVLMTELNWIWGKLDRLGAINSCPDLEIPPNWKIPVEADLRIAVTWPDAYADMDLWVVEPTGEISDWTNDQTAIGGIMTNCLGQGFGPEVYTLTHAIDGCYEISSHYWGGFGPTVSGPVPLLVAVFTDFGRPQEQVRFSLIRLENEDDLIDLGSVLILPEDPLSDQNGDAPEKHRHSRSD